MVWTLGTKQPWHINIVCVCLIGQCLIIGTGDQIFEAFAFGCGISTGVPVLRIASCFSVLRYLQYCYVLVEGCVFLGGKYATQDVIWGRKIIP